MFRFRYLALGEKLMPKHNTSVLKCPRKTFKSSSEGSAEYLTMQKIKKKLASLLKVEDYDKGLKHKEDLMKYLPKSQKELPIRKMKDSFASAIVPLSSNKGLRDKYTTFQGNIRLGRLMEDVDIFAVWCCTKHLIDIDAADSHPFPYSIVTVRVDHIELTNYLNQPIADVRVSGHVCWVGLTSLEVIIYVDQFLEGTWKRRTKALLLMAARNPLNTGPAIVNAIEAETEDEKMLLEGGKLRKEKRKQTQDESLLKKIPTKEELQLVHDLFVRTIDTKEVILDKRQLPPNSKWMQDATLNNLVFCHPEHRNMHNKIFGGFLIRQALELSWTIAFLYSMRAPRLIHISDIGFYNPVDLGSLLELYASVTYTEEDCIQVFVFAEALSLSSKELKNTTSFNFTYSLQKECASVYPLTYSEAMKYIDGRRRFLEFKEYYAQQKKNS